MNRDLAGWQIVILRPQEQASALVDYILARRGKPVLMPMLLIEPLTLSLRQQQEALIELAQASMVIVTSQNALRALPDAFIPLLSQRDILTMGQATSRALAAYQLQPYFTAPAGSTSESLLAEPFLQADQISGKTIVLLAGEGGRKLLAETLCQRGAKVIVLYLYRQMKPTVNGSALFASCFKGDDRCCFIATSLNILHHLLSLVPAENLSWLHQQPLIVISERIAKFAIESGFQHIFVATSADPQEIGQALDRMLDVCHSSSDF